MKLHDGNFRTGGSALPVWLLLGVLLCGLAGPTVSVADDSLDEMLAEVGEEYAVAYSSPFLYTFGPNANSNMYSTANIPWTKIVFGFGVKVMTSQINEDDQYFSKVITDVDLSDYDPGIAPGTTGDVVMSGPTIFGDPDTEGLIEGYVNGIQVFETEGISGLVDTRWSPLIAPEAYIGGVFGLKMTVRYLPEMDLGDLGKTKYWGYGLQWNANGVIKNLPVDVMVGFFNQEINVGSVYESKANSFFAAASKSYTMLTVYGGIALEDSELDVAYTPDDPALTDVAFTVEGIQDTRLTLGVSFDFLAKLNVEAGLGNKMTSFSAGLMFGF